MVQFFYKQVWTFDTKSISTKIGLSSLLIHIFCWNLSFPSYNVGWSNHVPFFNGSFDDDYCVYTIQIISLLPKFISTKKTSFEHYFFNFCNIYQNNTWTIKLPPKPSAKIPPTSGSSGCPNWHPRHMTYNMHVLIRTRLPDYSPEPTRGINVGHNSVVFTPQSNKALTCVYRGAQNVPRMTE